MEYGGSQAYGVAHNLKATQERQSVGVQLDWGDVDIVHNFAAERGEKGI